MKRSLKIFGQNYLGVQSVPLAAIIGSATLRYHDFDRTFLPVQDKYADRWQSIDRAFYQEVSLPPIVLYKVGEVYFVVDGHHRNARLHAGLLHGRERPYGLEGKNARLPPQPARPRDQGRDDLLRVRLAPQAASGGSGMIQRSTATLTIATAAAVASDHASTLLSGTRLSAEFGGA